MNPDNMFLPREFTPNSQINFVYTSSPASRSQMKSFLKFIKKKEFAKTKIFDVQRSKLDPRYLAASENERLKQLRRAIKTADWLSPVYGGTGCADIVRYLTKEDLAHLRRRRPIVNGASDTTFFINYLYFKLKLLNFHFSNAYGFLFHNVFDQFIKIISGRIEKYDYERKSYRWLNPSSGPTKKIEGVAVGGNLSTFRDLLDIADIRRMPWKDYILFIEDIETDIEDLHRIIIALEARGIFSKVKAVVIGVMNEGALESNWSKLNVIFGKKVKVEHIFEYLVSGVIEKRKEKKTPLYILQVDNFGHGIFKNQMIVPIGGKTIIYPNGKIEFVGPFVG